MFQETPAQVPTGPTADSSLLDASLPNVSDLAGDVALGATALLIFVAQFRKMLDFIYSQKGGETAL